MELFPKTSYNLHALRVLEYDRIREILASLADSDEGRSWLSTMFPYNNTEDIRRLLEEVDELMQAIRFDDPLPVISVHNIRNLFSQFGVEGYNLGIESIAAVADNLEFAQKVRQYFEEKAEKYPVTWNIARSIVPHEDIEKRIRKAITPDLTIADDASPELRLIRRRLVQARNSLRELVEKTLSGLSDEVVSERLVTLRNGRFVIPIRESMKNRIPGAVHDRSQTGKTLFIEPIASIEGNNRVCELEMAEQAEIQRILIELSTLIASAADDIVYNQDVLVRMDVIKAKALYGVRTDGVIPEVNDKPVLTIRMGRHPLLDWKYRKQGEGMSVVPLDIAIGESYVTIVITGPNAGGKTVALKTAGLLTLMALSGLPVPAAPGTTVYVPEGIFADIGDEQSIDNDLSTFSSHMQQTATILRESGAGSLVFLDELGGGTNPSDGEAIALAVLKKLTRNDALTIATTHHGGLKVFAHETEGVMNASMEFDNENLRPTFVFRTGVPGSSYAFEIAGRFGMPEDVLREAESLAGTERKSLEGLIAEMDEHVRIAEEEKKSAISERAKLETARIEYEKKRDDITKKRYEILEEAVVESKKIVEDANRRIESSIKSIREENAAHETIVEAKSQVILLEKELKQLSSRIPKKKKKTTGNPVRELKMGVPVRVESFDADAVVEEIMDNGRRARVRVGKSKASFVVDTGDIFESEVPHDKPEQVVRVNVHSPYIISNEIDLRGMTFDEARESLDMFLDRLHVSGIETVHVIHGKGSGVLRKKISAYLGEHPYVESYRLGYWNEGSTGVTVVTLNK